MTTDEPKTTEPPPHDWERALRGATPVLVCTRCSRVWYPDRRQPAAACAPKASRS